MRWAGAAPDGSPERAGDVAAPAGGRGGIVGEVVGGNGWKECIASSGGADLEAALAKSEAGVGSPIGDALLSDADTGGDAGPPAASEGRRRRCCASRPRRCRKRCGLCGLLGAAAVGLLCFFLWPRQPEWEVMDISVSKASVDGLITAFTHVGAGGGAGYPLNATVWMRNRNFVGARAGRGSFVVTFGEHELAHTHTGPAEIHSRSSSMVFAASEAFVPSAASAPLLAAVMSNNFHIVVNVDGQLPASSLGLSLTVRLHCQVEVNVLALLAVPADMVVGHNCSYAYGLA